MLLAGALTLLQTPLAVTNFSSGDTVRSSVAIVRGTTSADKVEIGRRGGPTMVVRAFDGKFSAPVELTPGSNVVVVKQGRNSVNTRLDYRPAKSGYRVMIAYLQASDEPMPKMMEVPKSDKSDVHTRMSTAAKLMQGFCEDHFRTTEGASKTFTLDYRPDGSVDIQYIRLPETGDQLRAKSGDNLWGQFNDFFSKRVDLGRTKVLAVMGFTRYDVATKKTTGHTALGGGSFALFGSGSIRYWPSSVADSARAFYDDTVVTSDKSFDDSGGRQRAWANASTAIGAMMHELGHAFGLPHTSDPRCIMSRGFDQFSAALLGCEIRKQNGAFFARAGSYWDPVHSARLSLSPYFQPDRPVTERPVAPKISRQGDTIRLEAADGLRLISVWQDDKKNWSRKFRAKNAEFSLKDLRSKIGGDAINVVATSASGGDVTVEFRD